MPIPTDRLIACKSRLKVFANSASTLLAIRYASAGLRSSLAIVDNGFCPARIQVSGRGAWHTITPVKLRWFAISLDDFKAGENAGIASLDFGHDRCEYVVERVAACNQLKGLVTRTLMALSFAQLGQAIDKA